MIYDDAMRKTQAYQEAPRMLAPWPSIIQWIGFAEEGLSPEQRLAYGSSLYELDSVAANGYADILYAEDDAKYVELAGQYYELEDGHMYERWHVEEAAEISGCWDEPEEGLIF